MNPPPPYESAVEKAIREAQERGEFDNLPHSGQPLPGLDGPDDELWWVRSYVHREGLSGEEFLPETLLLRRQCERIDDAVAALLTEQAVRDHVEELNRQVRRARLVSSGPQAVLRQVVVDDVVARWRDRQPSVTAAPPPAPPPVARWWSRWRWSNVRSARRARSSARTRSDGSCPGRIRRPPPVRGRDHGSPASEPPSRG